MIDYSTPGFPSQHLMYTGIHDTSIHIHTISINCTTPIVVMDTAWADSLQIQQLILITFGMVLLLSQHCLFRQLLMTFEPLTYNLVLLHLLSLSWSW